MPGNHILSSSSVLGSRHFSDRSSAYPAPAVLLSASRMLIGWYLNSRPLILSNHDIHPPLPALYLYQNERIKRRLEGRCFSRYVLWYFTPKFSVFSVHVACTASKIWLSKHVLGDSVTGQNRTSWLFDGAIPLLCSFWQLTISLKNARHRRCWSGECIPQPYRRHGYFRCSLPFHATWLTGILSNRGRWPNALYRPVDIRHATDPQTALSLSTYASPHLMPVWNIQSCGNCWVFSSTYFRY